MSNESKTNTSFDSETVPDVTEALTNDEARREQSRDDAASSAPATTSANASAPRQEASDLFPDTNWEVEYDFTAQDQVVAGPETTSTTTAEASHETPSPFPAAAGSSTGTGNPIGPEWVEVWPKTHIPFFVAWQDQMWMFQDGQACRGVDVASCRTFCYAIHDFPEEDGPGLMRVTGETKYAGVLARKRAEEMGDLGTETQFHTYKVVKRGKQEADVLYHIFPQTRLEQAQSACKAATGCVLFDPVGLLLGLLRKGGKTAQQALALHMESSAVVLAGNGEEIFLARRYPLLSVADHELTTVLRTIDQDLQLVQQERAISFSGLQWIEAVVQEQTPALPEMQLPLQPWPLVRFAMEEGMVWSALPEVLDFVDPRDALMGRKERVLRPLEKWEKWLRTGLFAAAAVLAVLAWTGSQVEHRLEAKTGRLESEVRSLEQRLQSYSYEIEGRDDVQNVVGLIQELALAGQAPSVGQVWNAFLAARPTDWQIERLRFSFQTGAITAQASGVVVEDPRRAEQGLRVFRRRLVEQGFAIADTRLQLRAERAQFALDVRYPWGGE